MGNLADYEPGTIAAHCLGIDVPASPFLHERRIDRINKAKYEGQEIAGGVHIVKKGDVVLELGAGIGLVGAVVSAKCSPQKVVSFEANPALIPHIRELYDINGLGETNSVRNEILVSAPERPATLPFYIHNSYLGSSLGGDPERAKEVVNIPTADFEATRQELKPDILLMDIEGGEKKILEHANLDGIRGIVIEFHPKAYGVDGMRACKSILKDVGFVPLNDLSTRLVWVAERTV
jgi:FkbM family methyltransferase